MCRPSCPCLLCPPLLLFPSTTAPRLLPVLPYRPSATRHNIKPADPRKTPAEQATVGLTDGVEYGAAGLAEEQRGEEGGRRGGEQQQRRPAGQQRRVEQPDACAKA